MKPQNLKNVHLKSISVVFTIFLLLLTAGCNSGNNTKKLTIAGSTTVLPISEDWASMFYSEKNIIVNVQGGGSTNGVNLVKSGQADIGASSRDLSEDERKDLRIIEIGKDALAIIVNNQNLVDDISSEQIRKIFTGEITNWKEVGGADRAIQVINRESGSGTRKTFEELVVCPRAMKKNGECKEMLLSAIVLNSNAEVKKSVELISDSIGYISFGFVDDKIKALILDGVNPIEMEVKSGHYPLARSLYYMIREEQHSPELIDFIEFIMSDEAQEVLHKEGYLPVK